MIQDDAFVVCNNLSLRKEIYENNNVNKISNVDYDNNLYDSNNHERVTLAISLGNNCKNAPDCCVLLYRIKLHFSCFPYVLHI